MRKIIFVAVALLYLSGCAISSKIEAVNAAADRSEFEGINKNSTFSISIPSSHSGPYSSIDQLNFNIEGGKYIGKNASAIVGQSRNTGKWEVLVILVDENSRWIELSKLD